MQFVIVNVKKEPIEIGEGKDMQYDIYDLLRIYIYIRRYTCMRTYIYIYSKCTISTLQ